MNLTLITGLVVLSGSLVYLLAAIRRPVENRQASVCAALCFLFLSASCLMPFLIPAGVVRTMTMAVFLAAAVWFLALGFQLFRRERRRMRGANAAS